ncbi:MAG: carbohydrate kinase family protein [Vicinamibacterales bacterium]
MRIPLRLPTGRPRDVLSVGLNSIDLLAEIDGHPAPNSKAELHALTELPGGQAATAAVAMARLGLTVSYAGRVGDDAYGRKGLESLAAEGVDVSGVTIVPGATSQFAVILVDRTTGTRTVLWHRHPGLDMVPADIPLAAVAQVAVLHVDCYETAAVTAAAEEARRVGTRTVIDVERVRPGTDRLLRSIDVIIAAEAFPREFTGRRAIGEALERLQVETGAAVACVTLGEEGSLCRVGTREIRTPAFRVPVVDSTGAGDVFRAGFVAAWIHGGESAEVEDALCWANAVAALKCRSLGARTAIPRLDEVRAFLARPM